MGDTAVGLTHSRGVRCGVGWELGGILDYSKLKVPSPGQISGGGGVFLFLTTQNSKYQILAKFQFVCVCGGGGVFLTTVELVFLAN